MEQTVRVGQAIALECRVAKDDIRYFRGRVSSSSNRHYLKFKGGELSVPNHSIKALYSLETNYEDIVAIRGVIIPERVNKQFREQIKDYLGRYCKMTSSDRTYEGVVTGIYLINSIHELKLINECDNIEPKFGYKIDTCIGKRFLDEPRVLDVEVITKRNEMQGSI